ncbi:MAG: hypothetical protein ACXWB9_03755, partial [Flavisolibacter sp.]
MKWMSLLICLLAVLSAYAQTNKPCSSPEIAQFNFWVGDWNLTWSDSLHGTNKIEKIYGDCTLQENFSDPKTGFSGKSWTVYNANYKTWQQTWVDNQGGYIHLTGGMVGDSMVLTTAEQKVPVSVSASGKILSRMVFYNIKKNSFDWSWEA